MVKPVYLRPDCAITWGQFFQKLGISKATPAPQDFFFLWTNAGDTHQPPTLGACQYFMSDRGGCPRPTSSKRRNEASERPHNSILMMPNSGKGGETQSTLIHQFITAKLKGHERTAFVERLKGDRTLRLAVIQAREASEPDQVTVSERAVTQLDMILGRIWEGNRLFPGDPYVAGIENRFNLVQRREGYFGEAIELAEELIKFGELEDLALENSYIAQQNLATARAKASKYGHSTPLSEINGVLAAFSRTHKPNLKDRLEPVYLRLRKAAALPVERLVGLDYSDPNNIGIFLASLRTLHPDNVYFVPRRYADEFAQKFQAEDLYQTVAKNEKLREALARFVKQPLSGSNIKDQVHGRVVAAHLLLEYFAVTREMESLTPVMDAFTALFRTTEKTEYSANYETGLLCFLVSHSRAFDEVWQGIKGPLLEAIAQGRYGPTTSFRKYGYIEVLALLQGRIAQDLELKKAVKKLAVSRKPALRAKSSAAVRHLGVEEAVPLYLTHLLTPREELDLSDRDYTTSTSNPQKNAASYMSEMSSETLKRLRFIGKKIHPALEGIDNLTGAVAFVLERRIRSDAFGSSYADLEIALLGLLSELDPEKMKQMFHLCVQRWNGDYGNPLYKFTSLAREKDLRDLHDDFLNLLKRVAAGEAGGKLAGSDYEAVFRLLKEWDLTRESIDEDILDYCLDTNKVSAGAISYFGNAEPSEKSVQLFVRAIQDEQDRFVPIAGLRAIGEPKFAEFLSERDVLSLLGALADEKQVYLGDLGGSTTQADESQKSLTRLVQSSAGKKIRGWLHTAWTSMLHASTADSLLSADEVESRALGRLTKILSVDQAPPRSLDQVSGLEAFLFFCHYQTPSKIYDLFLDALIKPEDDRTDDEEDAYRLVGHLMAEAFEPLKAYLLSEFSQGPLERQSLSIEAAKVLYQVTVFRKRPTLDDALSRLRMSTFGITDMELNATAPVYSELVTAFTKAYHDIKEAQRRNDVLSGLSEKDIARLICALTRQGKIQEALDILNEYPVNDETLLRNILYYQDVFEKEIDQN